MKRFWVVVTVLVLACGMFGQKDQAEAASSFGGYAHSVPPAGCTK